MFAVSENSHLVSRLVSSIVHIPKLQPFMVWAAFSCSHRGPYPVRQFRSLLGELGKIKGGEKMTAPFLMPEPVGEYLKRRDALIPAAAICVVSGCFRRHPRPRWMRGLLHEMKG